MRFKQTKPAVVAARATKRMRVDSDDDEEHRARPAAAKKVKVATVHHNEDSDEGLSDIDCLIQGPRKVSKVSAFVCSSVRNIDPANGPPLLYSVDCPLIRLSPNQPRRLPRKLFGRPMPYPRWVNLCSLTF